MHTIYRNGSTFYIYRNGYISGHVIHYTKCYIRGSVLHTIHFLIGTRIQTHFLYLIIKLNRIENPCAMNITALSAPSDRACTYFPLTHFQYTATFFSNSFDFIIFYAKSIPNGYRQLVHNERTKKKLIVLSKLYRDKVIAIHKNVCRNVPFRIKVYGPVREVLYFKWLLLADPKNKM